MMLIQLLKHQKQHCKALLKIAEKPNHFFAMALFFCPILYRRRSPGMQQLSFTLQGQISWYTAAELYSTRADFLVYSSRMTLYRGRSPGIQQQSNTHRKRSGAGGGDILEKRTEKDHWIIFQCKSTPAHFVQVF